MNKLNVIAETVFPSEIKTIEVQDDPIYGGAHEYHILDCLGFNNGKTEYGTTYQDIQFVKKLDDGTIIPGLQSEQLVIILIDRQKKLNNRFPSSHSDKAIKGLEMFLEACKERVEERMQRGVMGNLKK